MYIFRCVFFTYLIVAVLFSIRLVLGSVEGVRLIRFLSGVLGRVRQVLRALETVFSVAVMNSVGITQMSVIGSIMTLHTYNDTTFITRLFRAPECHYKRVLL